jgi:Raf kinase inhibitor-like YbhB/YbcL family protein
MKANIVVISAIAVIVGSLLAAGGARMNINSTAFQEGGNVPQKFTCDGSNVNPSLHFGGAPAEAKSLALIVDDPDAPSGLFTHWIIWNIDPKTTDIAENSAPPNAVQGTNDFGKTGYGGPCPPSGTHRYYFKIFALDRPLNLKTSAKRKELDAAMRGHTIAQGELMARYSRNK